MSPEISTALSLLLVGMITVTIVLSLVVITGNALIIFTNRLVPTIHEKVEPAISQKKVAAIAAAVSKLTSGKGKITKIKKNNPNGKGNRS